MSKEAMKLALEALEKCDSALAEELSAWDIDPPLHHVLEASNACGPAITAIREALEEQPAQRKPLTDDELNCVCGAVWKGDELVHTPRTKTPLTSKEIRAIEVDVATNLSLDYPSPAEQFTRAIEARHGIK